MLITGGGIPINKPTVRLYPAEIDALPWVRPEGAREGVWHKILAHDPGTGSHTRLMRVDPGLWMDAVEHDHWEEVYILEGGYQNADEYHPTGTYTCRSPHVRHGPFVTTDGDLVIEVRNYYGKDMNKPTVRLYPTEIAALQWERPEGAAEGVWQKLLSFDPDTGSHTRLLRVEPGVNVPGPFKHDHWEEAYVLQGSYQMADECHPAGTYICRAPNVVHGPFFTEEGYLSLQVRDYAPHTSFPSQ